MDINKFFRNVKEMIESAINALNDQMRSIPALEQRTSVAERIGNQRIIMKFITFLL